MNHSHRLTLHRTIHEVTTCSEMSDSAFAAALPQGRKKRWIVPFGSVISRTIFILRRRSWRSLLICLTTLLICHNAIAFDERIDDIMYQDPEFPQATARVEFSDELKPLWLQALARPDAELQRMAADTIALAHRSGMLDLDDTADQLLAVLQQKDLEPSVRRAIVNALITLDARHAAKPFADVAATGSQEIVKLVEPALARWNYEPMRTVWRQRLADPEVERARLQLAIECLGTVKDAESLPALLQIVNNANAQLPLRLAAARASAAIDGNGLIATANELATVETGQPMTSLLSATLLTESDSSEGISILKKLATSDSVAVSGLALRVLFEIDPKLIYDESSSAIHSTDANIRRLGCQALVHRADIDSVALLGPLLNDLDPSLRRDVADWLLALSKQADLRESVIQTAVDVVARDEWRALEQGLIVVAMLDYEPAAPRLLELLSHRRPEVLVTAAWGLRKMAVADALPAMLRQAEQQTTTVVDGSNEPRYTFAIDSQLSHLFQAFGEMGFKESDPLLRKFIPKTLLYNGRSRPAAVWALGKLHEGTVDERLAASLAQRLADVLSMEPEVESVRQMSAIAIGRMGAESQLQVLRDFVREAPGNAGQACAWSLERMTGEKRDFALEFTRTSSNWFLVPKKSPVATETE
ncbi:MAG: hypothetical protein KDB05_09090 [Planctomycetales bacterium]|nr:hypothetical protein [Planctomycetales bacterium]